LAWLKDADGNDIEIMSPFPQDVIDMMVDGAEPFNFSNP